MDPRYSLGYIGPMGSWRGSSKRWKWSKIILFWEVSLFDTFIPGPSKERSMYSLLEVSLGLPKTLEARGSVLEWESAARTLPYTSSRTSETVWSSTRTWHPGGRPTGPKRFGTTWSHGGGIGLQKRGFTTVSHRTFVFGAPWRSSCCRLRTAPHDWRESRVLWGPSARIPEEQLPSS